METDVLVCGAGPAGLSTASALAKQGIKTTVIDSDPRKPGKILVTWEGFVRENGLEDYVISMPQRMEWRSWLGPGYTLNKPEACVVDEAKALHHLKQGIRVKKADFLAWEIEAGGTTARTSAGGIKTRIIVDAMGVHSPIIKGTGRSAKRFMGCYSRLAEGIRIKDPDSIMIYDAFFPGDAGFWTVPMSEKSALIGMFSWKPLDNTFDNALDRYTRKQDLFSGKPRIKWVRSGNIPLDPLTNIVEGNILFVGDSASQPLPSTGFGFHRSVEAGKLAARHIIHALEKDDISLLVDYEREWEEKQGLGLNTQIILSYIISGFSDEQLACGIDSMNRVPAGVIRKFLQGTDMSIPFSYQLLYYTYKNFDVRELREIVTHSDYKKLVGTSYHDIKTYAKAKSLLTLEKALEKMQRRK
jgi:digeranylgeranylglycerophospholipid reductase